MDSYEVLLSPKALRDLDSVYAYISRVLQVPDTAEALIKKLETEIFSLEHFPYRCPERNIGTYANKGYRQLPIKNYTVIYRIDETNKQVVIITVRYSRSKP